MTQEENQSLAPAAQSALTAPLPADELHLVATDPDQMALAQRSLIEWFDRRIGQQTQEVKICEDQIAAAVQGGFESKPFTRQLGIAQKRLEYYRKLREAVVAGYTIIPDLPIELFAIRTNRERPEPMKSQNYGADRTQHSEGPPMGFAMTVNAQPIERDTFDHVKNSKGELVRIETRYAAEFNDVIDFPLIAARPEIMTETARAMALEVFDELGVLPGTTRKGSGRRPNKSVDPMVVGRVVDASSPKSRRRAVSFLIAWYVDTRDL